MAAYLEKIPMNSMEFFEYMLMVFVNATHTPAI
jgi:hypothetical protein